MKRIFTLALTTATLAGAMLLSAVAPAMAQGARFQYEPNVWRKEGPRYPKHHLGPQHSVSHGSMPKSNMLGLDKGFMKKPQPKLVPASNPMFRPTVAAKPASKQVRSTYKPSFGEPDAPNKPTPLVASQPKRLPDFGSPREMQAKPSPVVQADKQVAAKLAPRKHRTHRSHHQKVARSVSGVLKAPKKPVAEHAVAKHYNTGYSPGGYTPTHRNVGNSSRSDVYGKIINKF